MQEYEKLSAIEKSFFSRYKNEDNKIYFCLEIDAATPKNCLDSDCYNTIIFTDQALNNPFLSDINLHERKNIHYFICSKKMDALIAAYLPKDIEKAVLGNSTGLRMFSPCSLFDVKRINLNDYADVGKDFAVNQPESQQARIGIKF